MCVKLLYDLASVLVELYNLVSFPFSSVFSCSLDSMSLNWQHGQHIITFCIILSYGCNDRRHSGRKYQFFRIRGKTCGAFVCSTFITTTIITSSRIGANTATIAIQLMIESPNTAPGNRKNTTIRYRAANQRYLAVWLPKNFAMLIGKRKYGIGKNNKIPEILKNKWHSEICNEFGIASVLWASAAKIAVVVVPIFAPNVNGYILSIDTTPMPTNGVIADVNTELDCTRMVKPVPIRMAKYPVKYDNLPGKSAFTNFLMSLLTRPCRSELSVFTIQIRHAHNMTSAIISKTMPTVVSPQLSATLSNRYRPEADTWSEIPIYKCCLMITFEMFVFNRSLLYMETNGNVVLENILKATMAYPDKFII